MTCVRGLSGMTRVGVAQLTGVCGLLGMARAGGQPA